jgi:hypothetical protein
MNLAWFMQPYHCDRRLRHAVHCGMTAKGVAKIVKPYVVQSGGDADARPYIIVDLGVAVFAGIGKNKVSVTARDRSEKVARRSPEVDGPRAGLRLGQMSEATVEVRPAQRLDFTFARPGEKEQANDHALLRIALRIPTMPPTHSDLIPPTIPR